MAPAVFISADSPRSEPMLQCPAPLSAEVTVTPTERGNGYAVAIAWTG
ncbi:MAG: hypothetical protein R2709_14810 [Marmoricola sp.]